MGEGTEDETVAVEVREAIAWVKFNRPEKRNSMSPTLNRQMLRVLDDLEFRDDVAVPAPVSTSTPTSSRNSRSSRTRSICRLSVGLMELRFSGRLDLTLAMAS